MRGSLRCSMRRMGLMDKLKDARANAEYSAAYDVHSVNRGMYSYLPVGKFKQIRKPVSGAVAEFETGADAGGRTTLTRVAAGAIIAGPLGAIVAGMFKKDRNKIYVTVTFPDGDVAIIDAPAKDDSKLREFARKINAAGAHY